jgi:lactoylglutathione lyase
MTFAYTIIYVPDVEAAITFYEKAFGLARRFIAPGGEYGELDTGATTLAFAAESLIASVLPIPFTENRRAGNPAGIEVAFTTDDVHAAQQKAEAAGAEVVLRPIVKPWGQTVAYVRDLNGVLVEIGTPMGG